MNKISKDSKDTEKIAKEFLEYLCGRQDLPQACVVGLSGDLGTGKTTFTQFIAKNLGIKTKVKSPTFVIMKRYTLTPTLSRRERGHRYKNLFHIDAYRLKNEKELLHLGWEEIVSNPKNLIFIEWPENIKKAMPKKYHKVFIKHLPRRSGTKAGTKEGHRKFRIK